MSSPSDKFLLSTDDRKIVRVMILGISLPLLDTTLINVATPSLCDQFAATLAQVQWVTTAYTLATVAIIPMCAWAANRHGAKALWLLGLCIFFLGSLFSPIAWNLPSLILFRIIQGLGAGMLMPTVQIILALHIEERKIRRAFTATAVPAIMAPIAGPLVGGFLLHWTDWHWLFLINLPLSLCAFHQARKHLPNEVNDKTQHLDFLGLILLAPGLAATFLGLASLANNRSLLISDGLACLVLGLALSALFLFRACRMQATPLIDLAIFTIRSFRVVSTILFLSSVAFYGGLFLLPLFFLQVCHYNTMTMGLLLSVQGVGALAARSRLAWLSARWGDRNIALLALISGAAGTSVFVWPPAALNLACTLPALFIRGSGLGLLTLLAMSSVFRGLAKDQITHASITARIITQLGASVGAAGIALGLQSLFLALPALPIQEAYAWAFLGLSILTLAAAIPGSRMAARPIEK